ncbi:hypothetical protein [Bradyrhizobium sp.]|uniref:hypothetical protein n=1 Tax=Bradyrhizobium sp. TaxID=376 RepID=UPI002C4D9FCB|nr:hypothetical protein [Bradyrhizobium sp.]HMM87767.1 hypothetical protein [Bradyrhizobium sp.]
MIDALTHTRNLGLLLAAAIFAYTVPASAQGPSQAQRDAVKSQCRSDYIAHCSSVPPGGEASLQCLAKNMSSLSPSCQSAVRAVEAAAAPAKPAETAAPKPAAPAAATAASPKSGKPKAAAGAAAGQPTSSAVTGGGAAPAAGAAPATGAAATAAPAAPAVIVLRPLRPREELFVLRSACGGDVRTICGAVPPGGGRIVQCLATNASLISPACKDVLSQFAAR